MVSTSGRLRTAQMLLKTTDEGMDANRAQLERARAQEAIEKHAEELETEMQLMHVRPSKAATSSRQRPRPAWQDSYSSLCTV
jgi:hypothetical protein